MHRACVCLNTCVCFNYLLACGFKWNRNQNSNFVCLFWYSGSVPGFCFGLGVSFLHLDLWCDTAQNVEILITLSISVTKNMQCQIKKQHFYQRTLMLQKYHSQTTKPTHLFCFYSCSFDNTNPSDSHPPCLYILDDFLYRAVEEVFPWVYHVGQCSRANTDQLEKALGLGERRPPPNSACPPPTMLWHHLNH